MSDVINIISSFGFPVFCSLALGWYVYNQNKEYRAEIKDMQKEHREEIAKVSDALDRNTDILKKLCDRLDDKLDKEG